MVDLSIVFCMFTRPGKRTPGFRSQRSGKAMVEPSLSTSFVGQAAYCTYPHLQGTTRARLHWARRCTLSSMDKNDRILRGRRFNRRILGYTAGVGDCPMTWVYWTSPEKVWKSSHLVDHIPNGWVMFNGDMTNDPSYSFSTLSFWESSQPLFFLDATKFFPLNNGKEKNKKPLGFRFDLFPFEIDSFPSKKNGYHDPMTVTIKKQWNQQDHSGQRAIVPRVQQIHPARLTLEILDPGDPWSQNGGDLRFRTTYLGTSWGKKSVITSFNMV